MGGRWRTAAAAALQRRFRAALVQAPLPSQPSATRRLHTVPRRPLQAAAIQAARPAGPPAAARGLVTATSPKQIKRFYQDASVAEHEGVWRVLLDGKPVKTPKGTFLEFPSQPLAQAVAQEWAAQGEKLKPMEMRLTTLGCTAVDLIRPDIGECINRMMPFLSMDTLCFEDDSDELAGLQSKEWGPLRSWFEGHFGVSLGVARGLDIPQHQEDVLAVVEQKLKGRDEWELSAMEVATHTAKSFVMATALLDREDILAKEALRWALLEEHYQIERWGLVEGDHDVQHAEITLWLEACQRFGQPGRTLPPPE